MLKQLIAIIAISILVILGMTYAQQGLQFIVSAHDWISDTLKDVFSGGQAGNLIRELIALLAVPVVAALIPTLIYWLIKRSWFPYFMQIVGVLWLAQTAALVVLFKG